MTDKSFESVEKAVRPGEEMPLESWKEIAAYLQRDVKTAHRWEKYEGLPVHRHHHLSRSSVYAYPSELEAWRDGRKPETGRTGWWRPVPAFASSITIALALMMAGSGPHIGTTVQAADGIVTRQVWTGPDASADGTPSLDGRYLSFTDLGTGDLAIRDLTTGQNRRLTHKKGGWENWHEYAESPVFSPDGKQVAFGWYDQQDYGELRVISLDGSQERILYRTDKPGDVIQPADWSQDGKFILALLRTGSGTAAVSQIVAVVAVDGSLKTLKTLDWRFPNRMRFSPDDRFVAYDFPADDAGNFDVFVLSVIGGQVTPFVHHPAQDRLLGWAPDGRSILFLSDRTGNWGAWLVGVAGGRPEGEPKLVKRDVGAIQPMGFTREGSFYYGVRDPGYNVYVAAIDGGAPTLLVKRYLGANLRPVWSPDGNYIAYISRRSPPPGSTTLCVRSMKTGTDREYSPNLVWLDYLQWSPDGRSILFRAMTMEGEKGAYSINLETGQVAPVLVGSYGNWIVLPSWSVDGKAVYYIEPWVKKTERPARLMWRDLETGRDEEIRLLPKGVTTGWVFPSPDGRWFALWLIRGDEGSLAIMPAGGTEIQGLPGPWTEVPALSVTWAPDSRQVLFVRRAGRRGERSRAELWGVPVEGGEPRSLGFSMMRRSGSLSIHPNGRQLAFHVREPTTEIWVMENFLPSTRAAQ